MTIGFMPSAYSPALDRLAVEREVQNLIGPIRNVEQLTTSQLYGIRDAARSGWRFPPLTDQHRQAKSTISRAEEAGETKT